MFLVLVNIKVNKIIKFYEGNFSIGARSASIQLKPIHLAFMLLNKWLINNDIK